MDREFEQSYQKEIRRIQEKAELDICCLNKRIREEIAQIPNHRESIESWEKSHGGMSMENFLRAHEILYPEIFALHVRMREIQDAANEKITAVLVRMKEDWRKQNG